MGAKYYRFLTAIVGPRYVFKAGDVGELPAGEDAERLIAAGIIEPVQSAPEVAAMTTPETAARKTARKRRR